MPACGGVPTDDGTASGVSGVHCVDTVYLPYDYVYAVSWRQIVADTGAGATNTIAGHAHLSHRPLPCRVARGTALLPSPARTGQPRADDRRTREGHPLRASSTSLLPGVAGRASYGTTARRPRCGGWPLKEWGEGVLAYLRTENARCDREPERTPRHRHVGPATSGAEVR